MKETNSPKRSFKIHSVQNDENFFISSSCITELRHHMSFHYVHLNYYYLYQETYQASLVIISNTLQGFKSFVKTLVQKIITVSVKILLFLIKVNE